MPINWNFYENRLNALGATKRDRDIASIKLNAVRSGIYSPSCKSVSIGNENCFLFIDSTETAGSKTYTDVFDVVHHAGTLVTWAGATWLVDSYDVDNEVYADGKLLLCNYELRFLDANGNPKSKMCYVENYTKYNTGTRTTGLTNKMELGSTQFFIKLPLDSDTQTLDRVYTDGKEQRILLDKDTLRPKAYQITLADRVSYPGIVALSVSECLESADDNTELMMADYYSRINTDTLPVITSDYCEITYSGEPVLKVGQGYKAFSAVFKDLSGVVQPGVTPVWSLDSTSNLIQKVIIQYDTGRILLKVTDSELIGFKFDLVLEDESSEISSSIEIEVTDIG